MSDGRMPWIAGIVFAVVSIGVGVVAPGFEVEPTTGTAGLVADIVGGAGRRSAAAFASLLSLPLLFAFAAGMRRRLTGSTGDVFLAGAVLMGVAVVVSSGMDQMATSIEGLPEEAVLARLIVVFDWNSSLLFIPGILAMGASAAIGGRGPNGLPGWLVVGSGIVGLFALAPWMGAPFLLLWILAASTKLAMEQVPVAVT